MKRNIKNALLVCGSAILLASCSENTWNDKYLDGFESGVDYSNAVTGAYTLTADDYSAISKLMLAKATNASDTTAAKAIASNCYFDKNSVYPASVALPPFMETASFPYYLASDGSITDVSYEECDAVPAILSELAGATAYTVSKDDYINAWGSDVDYISAFAPMASAENKLPGILKNALPNAESGAYAIVSYNESATNPIFLADSDVEEFIGGSYYMVADGSVGAAAFKYSYTYGNLNSIDVTVSNGEVDTDAVNAFTFAPTNNGYYLIDVYGRYLYQTGTYNNFNVSYTVPESGAVWTVDVASNGSATITNNSTGKVLQYSGGKWGAFADVTGSIPTLYKAPYPQFYLMTEDGHGMLPLAETYNYGYPKSEEWTVTDGAVSTDTANAFTFEITNGGYYIKDTYGRYLYISGTYNSINVSTEAPEEGAVWTVTTNDDATVTIKNVLTGRWLQYTTDYGTWGVYDTETGSNPKMYNAAVKAAAASKPAKVVAGTPATTSQNAVYQYNGSAWSVAEGVSVLNPEDYTAMGFSNNSLTSPEIYIPLYLKNKLIYAQTGDQQVVVYNSNKVGMFVYDGSTWTLNDNGLENVVGRFTKENGEWSFAKYIGKATFNEFNEDQIMRDRSYLLVYGSVCASPIDQSSTYGYLPVSSVTVSGQTIVLPSDVSAFTFASSAVIDGTEYTAPDGKFLLVDSYNRYYYNYGSARPNVTTTVTLADGAIEQKFLWSAYKNEDGSWVIENALSEDDVRWLVYAEGYNNCALYNSITSTDHYFNLYIMD